MSSTKVQTAKAKVDIRLVDVKTGLACFSANGAGEASTESGEIAGFGSRAEYDATLNDRAIGAAISDVVDRLVDKLSDRPWRTDILEVRGTQVLITGGERQGLRPGDGSPPDPRPSRSPRLEGSPGPGPRPTLRLRT